MERIGGKAHLFDLDDTMVRRQPIARLGTRIKGLFSSDSGFERYTLADIPQFDHTWVNTSIPLTNVLERISFIAHSRRRAIPGIKERLEELFSKKEDLFGNTGRPSKLVWTRMTKWSLAREGLNRYLKDIFYTPKGVRTAVSKADVVRNFVSRYEEVECSDDDRPTVLLIARLFPKVRVNHIYYESTGKPISDEDQERYRNINIIPIESWRR